MVSTPIKELKLEQNVWRRPFRIYWTAHAQITVPSVASRYWGRSFRYSRTPGLTEKSWYSVSRDSEGVVWTPQEWALRTCERWFVRRFHLHGWSGTKIAFHQRAFFLVLFPPGGRTTWLSLPYCRHTPPTCSRSYQHTEDWDFLLGWTWKLRNHRQRSSRLLVQ